MPADAARRDPGVMNQAVGINQPARTYQQAPRLAEQDALTPRRDPTAGLAATLIGTAAIAASGRAAALSDVYATSHPLLTTACGILVTAAMALAFTRRRGLAALLLCAAAATPWIPAIGFLHHA
jgi:hypothetical protein